MGIYVRDYYRDSPSRGGFGHFSAFSVTTWLIAINVAVFFLDGILRRAYVPEMSDDAFGMSPAEYRRFYQYLMFAHMGPLERWGYFSTATAIYGGQVWRFLTFQFLHASGGHLIGNMLALFLFGP